VEMAGVNFESCKGWMGWMGWMGWETKLEV
jgi:hypothetical protein